jgi:hypothetical protein
MTEYLGIMVAPSGHRLVMQSGNTSFTTSANTKTLSLGFKRPVAAVISPNQAVGGTKTHIVAAYLPYVSASQFTHIAGRKLVVSRKTGSISALKFSYNLIGY